uniref:capsid protein n=1 Tax=Clostridium sp. NkU-1 TaxID=1095009 RepID=UPI0032610B10
MVDRFKDIITADLNDISFGEKGESQTLKKLWNEIAKENDFDGLLGEAVAGALSAGDGAFKISLDPVSQYPVIEFYEADRVEYKYQRGRLSELIFSTAYPYPNSKTKEYRLEETYGKGYVTYKLFDDGGEEVPLKALPETGVYEDTAFDGDYIMGIPLIFFSSSKWKGRGKALFEGKTDDLDALDEVISQWLDAVRKGRVNRYIPEDMVPRDPNTGQLIEPNEFDNDYITIGAVKKEGYSDKIEVSQPQISYEAYLNSYSAFMDLVLQGIISPATLGIDLKKTDNADSQREKEKITMHTRGTLVKVLCKVIPELVSRVMMTYDQMQKKSPGEYEVSIKFGEYAAPGFDSVVETVSKARTSGVMSIEKAIDELYGDTMMEDKKVEEIERIKVELGIMNTEEPNVAGYDGMEGAANAPETGITE